MGEEAGEIQRAVRVWLEYLVTNGMPPRGEGFLWEHLAEQPQWAPVRHAVTAVVQANERDDLCYRLGDGPEGPWTIDDQALLHVSGLGSLARALVKGAQIDPEEVAEGFARFCSAPRPAAEDWLLIEATFPIGTRVAIGDYTLQTFTWPELRDLHPFPTIRSHRSDRDLLLEPLAGAPFLHRVNTERGPAEAFSPRLVVRPRPETEHWQPLLPLLLWSPELTQIQANYEVERGRCVRLDQGSPSIWTTYDPGDDPEEDGLEELDCGAYRVGEEEVGEFAVFCREVVDRMQQVSAESGRAGRKRARRLTRAAQHLVRAAHRSGVSTARGVLAEEAEEVLLQYVIAMEALLADENNLDLSRKVAYRAATLWQTDADRQRVAKLVKDAYTERSKYVHGDDITEGRVPLGDLRAVASETLLRWLILATSGTKDVPGLLDSALLSETVRCAEIIKPINSFFGVARARSVSQAAADRALDGTEAHDGLQLTGPEASVGQDGRS